MGSYGARTALGLLLVAGLAAAIVWAVRQDGGAAGDATVAPDGSASVSTAPTPAPVPVSPGPLEAPVATGTQATGDGTGGDGAEEAMSAAAAALEAWGRFAVSFDLAELEGLFAPGGPQYALLADEAAAAPPVGGPPYDVRMQGAAALATSPGEVVVRADVVFSRPGEAAQVLPWDIVMRRVGQRWLLWTVTEQTS